MVIDLLLGLLGVGIFIINCREAEAILAGFFMVATDPGKPLWWLLRAAGCVVLGLLAAGLVAAQGVLVFLLLLM
jgi:hypothetical protein